ncbi:MAG: glycosyltransferase family 2 protein [Candidatus Marsarchaeota archaeon]|jgi:cellulose synthase/poly-beta-1,6-N-acetylglucosamine synthase-like glycosyltransferase|nr:glycosyltransferase family 2 protein [Candidatus Marsarchaeota archaeon]MCL5111744.1 glycosyltransferase family 2 protein [Candidatus Marsarchaeota archaeon]
MPVKDRNSDASTLRGLLRNATPAAGLGMLFDAVKVYEEFAVGYIVLTGSYLMYDLLRGRKWAARAEPVSSFDEYPFASIMVPVYNEPAAMVQKSIDSMLSQDYPNYEVIVADDSEKPLNVRGDQRCKFVHRKSRDGFKGGALRNAFGHLDGRSKLIAVFDSDFLLERDTLRRLADKFTDSRVGAAQGFMDTSRNLGKTRFTTFMDLVSRMSRDILEGRYRRGGFVCAQGSVQMYRREAIDQIGGVAPYKTVNEDLDTSFRLKMAGWKIVYDPSISAKGMAAESYVTFKNQLGRWTSSTIREFRRHTAAFLKSECVSLREKIDSMLFLSLWTTSLVVTPTLAMIPVLFLSSEVPYSTEASAVMTALPVATFLGSIKKKGDIKTSLVGLGYYFATLLPGYIYSFGAAVSGLLREGTFNKTLKGTNGENNGNSGK